MMYTDVPDLSPYKILHYYTNSLLNTPTPNVKVCIAAMLSVYKDSTLKTLHHKVHN
jgi:hypothetical protein